MKANKRIIFFAVVYILITLGLYGNMKEDQSMTIAYVLLYFPAFWIMGGLLLGFLLKFKKISIKTPIDFAAFILSTPLPVIAFLVIRSFSPAAQSPSYTREYNRDGHRHREVMYQYTDGQKERIEYYKSRDSVSESNPFPAEDVWLKDSVWTYYNTDASIKKQVNYK
ncbi:hypothetical protein [Pontibacter fetidus]|nr:hypothetical protein [Pontibacter fetidus]